MSTFRQIQRKEQNFEELLQNIEFESKETDLTPELRRERRKKADNDPLQFAKIYFPKIFSEPFNDVHRHIASLEQGNYTISGFPKSGKSAFAFVGRMVRHIALGNGGIVAAVARTQDKAEMRTSSLVRIIKANRQLKYDYELEFIQDKTGHAIIKSDGGTTQLVAGSVNTGLRNIVDDEFNRITLAVGDDLYDKETVRSETDNERVTNWIKGELWRQMEDDGLSIVLGNAINDDCPIVKLRKKYPERHFSFPIKDEEGNSNWPDVYSEEDIEEMRKETPFDVWEGEFMDDPSEKGDVFEPEWLRSVNIPMTRIIASITAIDPSHGESPNSCDKGMFTLGATDGQEVVALDVYVRSEPYMQVFDYMAALHREMPAHKVFLFENDFAQWNYARPYYSSWKESRGQGLPIIMHRASDLKTEHRAADKESRMMNLVHPHQFGQFLYHAGMMQGRDWDKYRKQVLAFSSNNVKGLDGLDAAATAYIKIFQYKGDNNIQAMGPSKKFNRPSWDGGFH